MQTYIWIFIGGGLGSILRYLCSIYIQNNPVSAWPLATLTANAVSCLLLGILLALRVRGELSQSLILLLMTGLCGGFSTFSTFSMETFLMLEEGLFSKALIYMLSSVISGVLLLFAGYKLVAV